MSLPDALPISARQPDANPGGAVLHRNKRNLPVARLTRFPALQRTDHDRTLHWRNPAVRLQFRTERLGVLQRRVDGDLAEHRIVFVAGHPVRRSEEHTSELQSLMRISYAVFCLQNKTPTI